MKKLKKSFQQNHQIKDEVLNYKKKQIMKKKKKVENYYFI